MYKLSIPIISQYVDKSNREDFCSELKRAGADRVMLTTLDVYTDMDAVKENVDYFKAQGLDVAIWVGSTVGHGNPQLDADGALSGIQPLVNLEGAPSKIARCPLDKKFQRIWGEYIAKCAATGASFVLLDDDFRLSQHGASFCCACDLHMAKMREYCKEDVSREDIKRLAFSGKPNKYRAAWLKAQSESLEELARAFRREVDKLAPDVPVAVCSCYCTIGLDGADVEKITEILAGNNKKYLRLHGAPYWSYNSNIALPEVFEIARMFPSFLKGDDIETMSECDSYPRPRFNCPSSYLELFDAAMRADGSYGGILKYMMEYNSHPLHETGYIDRHCRDAEALEAVSRLFPRGADYGVRVLLAPHMFADADLSVNAVSQMEPLPKAGTLLTSSSIPTVYRGEGICRAVFDESARHFSKEELGDGVIIDSAAALILTERGIDVGIDKFLGTQDLNDFTLTDAESGVGSLVLHTGVVWVTRCELKEGASVLTYVSGGGERLPFAYNYENAEGVRFTVFLYNSKPTSCNTRMITSYAVSAALRRAIPYLSRKPLAYSTGHAPALYTECSRDENSISVLMCNCFADSVLSPTVELDREYGKVEFVGAQGRIEGNKVIFETDVPAYGFVAFRTFG